MWPCQAPWPPASLCQPCCPRPWWPSRSSTTTSSSTRCHTGRHDARRRTRVVAPGWCRCRCGRTSCSSWRRRECRSLSQGLVPYPDGWRAHKPYLTQTTAMAHDPGVPCRTIRWCRTAAGSLMAADRARAFSPVPVRSSCLEAGMPLVEVSLIEGRTPEQIRSLIHELHEAVVRALTAPPGNVRIIVREVPATHWAASDVTIAERHE